MDSRVQAGPGLFGWYPLLDRSGGGDAAGPRRRPYYLQVALQESFQLSGIPEYLRVLLKPVVDVILNGSDPLSATRPPLLAQGAGLLARDVSDIESALVRCTCSANPERAGEPFASLREHLSSDQPKLTRRALTNLTGEGLLLRDLVEVQRRLGACRCKGRPKDVAEGGGI